MIGSCLKFALKKGQLLKKIVQRCLSQLSVLEVCNGVSFLKVIDGENTETETLPAEIYVFHRFE